MSSDVSRAGSSVSVSGYGVKRKSSCPFGDGYYSRLVRLLLSDEASSVEELKDCVKMVYSAKLLATDEFWDSGDELYVDSLRAPIHKKLAQDRIRIMKLDNVPGQRKAQKSKGAAIVEKKIKKDDLSDFGDSDSESNKITDKSCLKCGEASTPNNVILTCEGCRACYHQRCQNHELSAQNSLDIRLPYVCAECGSKNLNLKSRSVSPNQAQSARSLDDKHSKGSQSTTELSETYKKKKERQIAKAQGVLKK